ncbi:hypothetical protein [Desulfosporosinus sp. FKB]|uniref:hypothetical protein n=1 Tax=Desulfosporosinus sp. FKB TaxID=1969835 RepID=UPI000B496DE7|nr:hypothetical protein [Desulfosporosinus sp. FKB]
MSLKRLLSNSNFSKRKLQLGAIIFSCICIALILWASNYRDFNSNITEGDKSFKAENYSDAIEHYKAALSYKTDDSVQEKLKLANSLKLSSDKYQEGMNQLNNKNYLEAYDAFKEVIPQDSKRFSSAKDKIAECSKLYINGKFADAKAASSNQDYDTAINEINLVLKFDSSNETAKALLQQYQADLDAEAKAQAAADAKAQAETDAKAKALAKTRGVKIGMTAQEILDSAWGKPNKINRTVTTFGTHEQWVYDNGGYLYLDNGILTAVQN